VSGCLPQPAPERDPALDDGVLTPGPVLELGGWHAVARWGGIAILPWRGDHLAANAAGLSCAPLVPERFDGATALVRVQRGRAATAAAIASAWAALPLAGELAITGANDLGIGSWCERVAAVAGAPLRLVTRAKARVAVFRRHAGPRPELPADGQVPFLPSDARLLRAVPGVFSGDGLDEGTRLLLSHLPALAPASRIADLGCGMGHLGLAALTNWPAAVADLLDADHRAVRSANHNAAMLGLTDRCQVHWWTTNEPIPASGHDLVLCNPPCHQGTSVDLGVARQLFAVAGAMALPVARLLVVANRRLPYEADLARFGRVESLVETAGFKLLLATRG